MKPDTTIPEQFQFVSDDFPHLRGPKQRQEERDKRHLQDALYEIMEQSEKVRDWILRARRECDMKRRRVRKIAQRYVRDE